MKNVMYKVINTRLKSVLLLCWNGDIKLWKAFWLVNVFGNFIAAWIAILIAYISYTLGLKIPLIFFGASLAVYGVFSIVTLWRCTSKSIDLVRGALIKLYIILFSIFYIPITLKFF